ncbi:hypothetical protein C8R45DRAFT_90262 [Mycena sanguinolenta]|nr:hypothetical protein C8R45DRAFT_90262 [Mycena sanguinolenta]
MEDAPSSLLLSALTWTGDPTIWCADEAEEYVGTYNEAAAVELNKSGITTQLGVVEYTPERPVVFQYTRRAQVGKVSFDAACALFGNNMAPLVRICLLGRLPWPERFGRHHGLDHDRRRTGPLFHFWSADCLDETGLNPECLHGLTFAADLPGQPGNNSDSIVDCLGWQGSWVTALLEKQDQDQPWGERNEIIWNVSPKEDQIPEPATWGVEVCLKPMQITELDPDIYEDKDDPVPSRGISSYTVRATILRVFVKSEWFVQQSNAVESNEDEDEDMDSEEEDYGEEDYDEEDDHEGMNSHYDY